MSHYTAMHDLVSGKIGIITALPPNTYINRSGQRSESPPAGVLMIQIALVQQRCHSLLACLPETYFVCNLNALCISRFEGAGTIIRLGRADKSTCAL